MNISSISGQVQKLTNQLYRHRIVICIVGFVGCYVFLILQISAYTQREPVMEPGDTAIKRLIIDADSIEQLEALEDQNVEVRTLFNDARKNPFAE
jgi:hypothetical protein